MASLTPEHELHFSHTVGHRPTPLLPGMTPLRPRNVRSQTAASSNTASMPSTLQAAVLSSGVGTGSSDLSSFHQWDASFPHMMLPTSGQGDHFAQMFPPPTAEIDRMDGLEGIQPLCRPVMPSSQEQGSFQEIPNLHHVDAKFCSRMTSATPNQHHSCADVTSEAVAASLAPCTWGPPLLTSSSLATSQPGSVSSLSSASFQLLDPEGAPLARAPESSSSAQVAMATGLPDAPVGTFHMQYPELQGGRQLASSLEYSGQLSSLLLQHELAQSDLSDQELDLLFHSEHDPGFMGNAQRRGQPDGSVLELLGTTWQPPALADYGWEPMQGASLGSEAAFSPEAVLDQLQRKHMFDTVPATVISPVRREASQQSHSPLWDAGAALPSQLSTEEPLPGGGHTPSNKRRAGGALYGVLLNTSRPQKNSDAMHCQETSSPFQRITASTGSGGFFPEASAASEDLTSRTEFITNYYSQQEMLQAEAVFAGERGIMGTQVPLVPATVPLEASSLLPAAAAASVRLAKSVQSMKGMVGSRGTTISALHHDYTWRSAGVGIEAAMSPATAPRAILKTEETVEGAFVGQHHRAGGLEKPFPERKRSWLGVMHETGGHVLDGSNAAEDMDMWRRTVGTGGQVDLPSRGRGNLVSCESEGDEGDGRKEGLNKRVLAPETSMSRRSDPQTEDERRARKLALNREAAKRMRQRQALQLEHMEKAVLELQATNQMARKRLKEAESKLAELEERNSQVEKRVVEFVGTSESGAHVSEKMRGKVAGLIDCLTSEARSRVQCSESPTRSDETAFGVEEGRSDADIGGYTEAMAPVSQCP